MWGPIWTPTHPPGNLPSQSGGGWTGGFPFIGHLIRPCPPLLLTLRWLSMSSVQRDQQGADTSEAFRSNLGTHFNPLVSPSSDLSTWGHCGPMRVGCAQGTTLKHYRHNVGVRDRGSVRSVSAQSQDMDCYRTVGTMEAQGQRRGRLTRAERHLVCVTVGTGLPEAWPAACTCC